MKKTIALFSLVLCILAGLVSGSLALYTNTVDIEETGSVVAKKFYIGATGDAATFKDNVLIAPKEKVTAVFTVTNNDGAGYTTEVGMDLKIVVEIAAADGKTAIPCLTAKLLDGEGTAVTEIDLTAGVGTADLFIDHAFSANEAATKTYQIELEWVPTDNDYNYQGPSYGSAYSVTVIGTQDIG